VSDIDTIDDIYEAVGDVTRWQRLNDRLASAGPPSTEVAWHLTIARKVHEQQEHLNREISTLMTVHDQLTLGAIMVDEDGRILGANAIASRHLAEQATLTLVDGKVQALLCDDNVVLSDAIRQASTATNANAPRSPFLVLTRERRPPLSVVVIRGGRQSDGSFDTSRPVALLLIDPELTAPPGTDVLRALFGFTAREAELAAFLMKGHSLEEAARALGVAITTARTFLAHITAKTESRSQPDLMRRLLAIPHVT
jgi:DNA-binding CsgD family transcriptional regulator